MSEHVPTAASAEGEDVLTVPNEAEAPEDHVTVEAALRCADSASYDDRPDIVEDCDSDSDSDSGSGSDEKGMPELVRVDDDEDTASIASSDSCNTEFVSNHIRFTTHYISQCTILYMSVINKTYNSWVFASSYI